MGENSLCSVSSVADFLVNTSRPRLAAFLSLSLLAIIGTFLILIATPEGLGLSDDSIAYIAGARSILAGQGYREAWLASNQPVTHFPPGFSSALAFIGLFDLDPLRGARFLNALLFGLNAFLLGTLGWRMTKSLPAGLILAVLFVSNSSLLHVHAAAMSEPLFIFLSLLAFWMFDLFWERDAHWLWLFLCAGFTGMAYLTRYAGLALIAAFIVALIVLHDNWQKRFKSVSIFIVSVLPWMAGWAIRNKLVAENSTNRVFLWHPITADNISLGVRTFAGFLVPVEAWKRELSKTPGFFETVLSILGLILFVWIVLIAMKRLLQSSIPRPEIISFTNGLYIFSYLASIVASMTLFDASTKFKLRILSPIYVGLLILLVAAGTWLWGKRREVTVLLSVIILGLSSYDQSIAIAELMKGGTGYASFQWYDSKAMSFLRGLPADIAIYTNEPGAVYLYTGRGCYVLPNTFDPVTGAPRSGFEEGVGILQADILNGKAVLALFDGGETMPVELPVLTAGLPLVHKSAGDEIYAVEGLK